MSEQLSMLVPLETLPGWPVAPNPPALHSLGLLIGIPAAAFVLITIFSKISAAASKASGGIISTTDTVWLGASPKSLGTDGGEQVAIEATAATGSGSSGPGSAGSTAIGSTGSGSTAIGSTSSPKIGGASARW